MTFLLVVGAAPTVTGSEPGIGIGDEAGESNGEEDVPIGAAGCCGACGCSGGVVGVGPC